MGLNKVKWVDTIPPRLGGTARISKAERIAKVLKANPNRWAKVGSFQNSRELRNAEGRLRKAGLRVAVRKANGGWSSIYAQYETSRPKSKR